MSWFQRRTHKPGGMYRASSIEYACASCAYYRQQICHIHKRQIDEPKRMKCSDFLREDQSIPAWKEHSRE